MTRAGLPRRVVLSPLERICAPCGLDGSQGAFRLAPHQLKIPVASDAEAVRLWLEQIENTESRRNMRSAPEKLLNWSWWIKGKALSSLTSEDLLEFQEFLGNPPACWISRKGTPRNSHDWTPFNRPGAAAHVQTVMNGLGSLFNWMRDIGYADVKLATRYRVTKFGPVPSRGASNSLPEESFSRLDFRDLEFVEKALSGTLTRTPLRMRLLFDLQFYGCLDAAEVERLRFGDIEFPEQGCGLVRLRILERHPARTMVYALPPLHKTLLDWYAAQRSSQRDAGPILLGYGAGDIRKASARLVDFAAREAELAGDRGSHQRLQQFRSGDLRHALLDALPTQNLGAAWQALGASIVADHRTAVRRLPDRTYLPEEELRLSIAAIMSAIQDGADLTSRESLEKSRR